MTTIYHNPRCSKSRETLALLEEKGIKLTVRLYMENRPKVDELKNVLHFLSFQPIELMRTKEAIYKELNLHLPETTDAQRLSAMCQYPKLIERPIVIHKGKAKIGRPPEQVLELF